MSITKPMNRNEINQLYETVGQRIKAMRQQRGMTQGDLGMALGLTHSTIRSIEEGHQSMLLHRLYQIADTLNVEIDDIWPALQGLRAEGPWYLDGDAWDVPNVMIRGN